MFPNLVKAIFLWFIQKSFRDNPVNNFIIANKSLVRFWKSDGSIKFTSQMHVYYKMLLLTVIQPFWGLSLTAPVLIMVQKMKIGTFGLSKVPLSRKSNWPYHYLIYINYHMAKVSPSLGCPSGTKFLRSSFCFLPELTLGLNSSKNFFWNLPTWGFLTPVPS